MKPRHYQWADILLRLILSAVFLWAGGQKAWRPDLFANDVRTFPWVADPWPAMIAIFLPWLELVAAASLWTPLKRGATLLLGTMLGGFIVLLAVAQYFGWQIRCGCFGASTGEMNYTQAYLRNGALLAVTVALVWLWQGRVKVAKIQPQAT